MDIGATKQNDSPAPCDTSVVRVGIRVGGTAAVVWLICNALAASVYLFDKHTRSHPAFDVFVLHTGEIVASVLLLRYYKLGWRNAGFRSQVREIHWFSDLALIVFLNLSLAGVMRLFHTPETHVGLSQGQRLLLLCAYAPFSEEVFVRGWLQAALLRCAGETRALFSIVGSSIFFAGMHCFVGGGPIGTIVNVVGAFLMGLIAAKVRDRTGSLVPAIAVHAAYNITGLFLAAPIWSLLIRGLAGCPTL